jgi:hypothetical protein
MSKKKPNLVDRHIDGLKRLGKSMEVEAGWFESARYVAAPPTKNGSGKKETGGVTPNSKIDPKKVGMSIAWVMRIQNFGAVIKRKDGKIIRIPPRPFMQLAFANFLKRRRKVQDALTKKILEGKLKPEQMLGQIGLELEGCITDAMRDGGWVANAASTVEQKGFDKPLIDTAQAFQGVASAVNGKVQEKT